MEIDLAAGIGRGGGAEGDVLISIEDVYRSAYKDILLGDSGANFIGGDNGDDELQGRGGDDFLDGWSGIDTAIFAGNSREYFFEVSGDSLIVTDTTEGRDDTDTLTGIEMIRFGEAEISVSAIIENIEEFNAITQEHLSILHNTIITGTDSHESLIGSDNADTIYGHGGNDNIDGGSGSDTIFGGAGRDNLFGGGGDDTFVFDTALSGANIDRISDFAAGLDTIGLDQDIFSALTDEGVLAAEYFKAGTTGMAEDDNDYLLYNTTSGALLYDADGNGQGVAVEFANLTSKPELTAKDFVIAA